VLITRRHHRRRGAVVAESCLVLSVFLLLLFGMFEYCRFIMVLQVANNAARNGARYAVVNLDKPSNFDTTDYTDAGGNVYPSIRNFTTSQMGGTQQNLELAAGCPMVVTYSVDPAGLALSPPVVRPMSSNPPNYPNPLLGASDPNAAYAVPWNTAAFTQKIAVVVNGTYRPILPAFLFMPSTIPVTAVSIMGAE
jgi:Flp pilus assembly protein TadG